jgi:hypothetical protein
MALLIPSRVDFPRYEVIVNLLLPLTLDRITRAIHYRLGLHIAKKNTMAKDRSGGGVTSEIARKFDKINIGCGHDKFPGYLNVDVDPACSPDILLVAGDDSMIPRKHFSEVYANDVLEHIPRAKTLGALLDWADYLVEGGKLVIQTSSILGVAAKLRELPSYQEQHGWTICLFGNQAHPGDFHFTGFTDVTLKVHFHAAGFRIDSVGLRDDWLLTMEGTKVENWTALCDADIHSDAEFLQEAYRRALFREIDKPALTQTIHALETGASRKDVLKALYASPERLFRVAEHNGL